MSLAIQKPEPYLSGFGMYPVFVCPIFGSPLFFGSPETGQKPILSLITVTSKYRTRPFVDWLICVLKGMVRYSNGIKIQDKYVRFWNGWPSCLLPLS
jgi:hypothetical protein